jgi:peptide/nickel transport system permease protein
MSRLGTRPLAAAALAVLVLLVVLSFAAPGIEALMGIDALADNLLMRFQPPSAAHLFGTDDIGRDVLLRLLDGGRVSLTVGFIAAVMAAAIGTVMGVLAGYFGGRADAILMRLTDGVIALPLLPLLIVLAAVDLSKLGLSGLAQSESASLYRIIAITALVGWTTVARLVRGATLSLKSRDFVRAAIALGASPLRVMAVHILPNAISPIIVATTLAVGQIILFESVLSFLGLGIQPPLPSWGNMLTNAQEVIWTAPWLAVYPGLLILLTVASCNLLGDALQEILDPRSGRPKR